MEAMLSHLDSRQDWVLDSGASTHMSRDKTSFDSFQRTAETSNVLTANAMKMPVAGSGCISFSANKALPEVLYIPTISRNLLSIGKLTDQGHRVLFDSKKCYVISNQNKSMFLTGIQDLITKLYKLSIATSRHAQYSPQCHIAEPTTSLAYKWHLHLGHPSYQRVQYMTPNNLVRGIPHLPLLNHICETCVQGKQTRQRIPKISSSRSTRPLQLIHSDLCGPLPTASLFQSRYFITFTDDHSSQLNQS